MTWEMTGKMTQKMRIMQNQKMMVKDLSFSYNSKAVLKKISFEVKEGEMVFIIGPNGSGKSTLLKCLNGILKGKGAVYIGETDLRRLSKREIAKIVGYVPQRCEVNHLTVFDTILLGRRPHIGWNIEQKDIEVVKKVIKLLNLEKLSFRRLTQLSGGELQMVTIARALAQEPKILLLDEPTNNLDLKNQIEVMRILDEIAKKEGISVITAMHDLNLASLYADRIIMLKDSRIIAMGGTEILTTENIERVYDVRVSILQHEGKPLILPV